MIVKNVFFVLIVLLIQVSFGQAQIAPGAKAGNRSGRTTIAKNSNPSKPETKVVKDLSADAGEIPPVKDTPEIVTLPEATNSDVPTSDLQSGNVVVNVNSNGNAVIKLGLAERGVTVIDFPVDDPVYRIHPGDENFVTVGCTEREENGKCGNSPIDAIVLRPGKNFHSLGSEESAATIVTVQRVSGIVVSFIVVPVRKISQSANYVVVRYNLKDVVESRVKAGLAVNLQPGIGRGITDAQIAPVLDLPNEQKAVFLEAKAVDSVRTASSPDEPRSAESMLSDDVVAKLKEAASNQSGLRFSKPVQGISLARVSLVSRTGDTTIEVIAVRNVLSSAIRLVPEQPELVIENREKRNSSVNVQRVDLLHIATTAEEDDVLTPGRVYYYAFAYTSPILGVKQALRVSFAQREAADAPATLELSGISR